MNQQKIPLVSSPWDGVYQSVIPVCTLSLMRPNDTKAVEKPCLHHKSLCNINTGEDINLN